MDFDLHSDQRKVNVPEGTAGDWCVEQYEITRSAALSSELRDALNPQRARRAVKEGNYTRLMHGSSLVMSDTRAEVLDHLAVIKEIERGGRILVHGLGLGLIVQAALRCPAVDSIDVIELNREVVELVGPHYLGRPLATAASPDPYSPNERWASVDQRLRIYLGDALTFKFAPGARWSVVWHDIWIDPTRDNLPTMRRLHRRYGSRCRWQGSWARAEMEGLPW